ncbi:tandem-95 repeat protein [Leptothrix sp. BB-3]
MSHRQSWKKHHTAAAPRAWSLEARLMFDAAAAADLAHRTDVATDTHLVELQARETTDAAATRDSSVAAPAVAVAPTAHEIAFIDRDLADLDLLIGGVRPGVEVVLLDTGAGADPWAQMSDALAARPGTTAVHLVSHGNQGELILGEQAYTAADLQARAGQIGAWRDVLAPGADILIYGCDIAAGRQGQALADTLARLSGADVAASNDTTGGAGQGDWALEYRTGDVSAAHFLSDTAETGYANRLATVALNGSAGWVPVMFGATRDPQGDSQAGAADTDIIGDATHGSLYTAFSDGGTNGTGDDYLYFRLRIDNPTSTSNFSGVAVVGMDVDGDGRVDLFMSVDGRNNGQAVRLLDPGTGANNSPNTTSTAPLPTGWLPNNGVYAFSSSNYSVTAVSAATDPNWGASSTGRSGATADNLTGIGGTDVFVSWRVPIADLAAVLAKPSPVDRNGVHGPRGATGIAGFNSNTTVSYVSFTQTQNGPINGDLNGVGASYDKNATFAQLGVYTAPMTAANPVAASTGLTITDNVAGTARGGQDVTFTFTFTEGVNGFDASDVSVANGTKGTFTAVDARTYTLVVTPTQGSAGGDVTVSVDSAAATGVSGLPTLAGSSRQAYDTLAPTVTVGTPALALSGTPTLTGTTDLPDGALVTVTIDPDHDASTLDTVVYQALVSGGVWTLNTATAVPTSGRLPAAGLNASSQVTATATDAAGNSSSAVELNRPTVASLSTTSTAPTLSGRWTRLAGDSLSVSVNGATYQLTPAGDTWSLDLATATPSSGTLGTLVAGQTYAVTATVTRGGVSTSDTTSGELVITSAPVIAVGIDGGDAVSGSSTRPTLTGTSSSAGGFVIVRLDPNNDGNLSDAVTYSVTPDGAGNWSLNTASATPISGTVPSGGYTGTVGVRATDSQGVVADTQVLTISTPTVAIGTISSGATTNANAIVGNSGGGASWLNLTEVANVSVSGTATGGSSVDLVISDANGHQVTVSGVAVSAGTWTASGVNLSSLDNSTLTVRATLVGTDATATNSAVAIDTRPPQIFNTTGSEIKKSAPVITGSSELPNTVLTVSFTVSGTTQNVDVTTDANGRWTTAALLNSPTGNPSTSTVSVAPKVQTTDAAGNIVKAVTWTQTLTASAATNTLRIGTIGGADNTITYSATQDEITGGVTLSGTTTLTGTPTVNITVTDANSTSVNLTATASGGTWTTTMTAAQARTLVNGPLTVTATALDGAITIRDATQTQLSLASPTLTITDDVPGTASAPVTFTFTFSEAVTNFSAADVTVTGGTKGAFSGSGTTYTLVVTPTASSSGTISLTVADDLPASPVKGTTSGRNAVLVNATQAYETTGAAAAPSVTVNADGLASSSTPVISGTTSLAAGAPVVITIDPDNDAGTANSVSYSATVQSGGTWSIDLSTATPTSGSLPAGGLPSYAKVSATATNAYGNSTTAVAHDAPAVTASTTADSTPTISGTWTQLAGDTLTVTVDGTLYTPVISGNTWTVDVGTVLADGTHQVVATTTRGATGKSDVTTGELVIDTTATVDITGAATVGPISSATPVIAGTTTGLAAGTVLTLELDSDGNGSFDLSYQTTIAADGSWSVDTATAIPVTGALPAAGLTDSVSMRASATDAVGNTGTDTQTLLIDTTPPDIAWTSGSRSASSLPLIRGTTDLPAGSTITLAIDPNNDGDWSDQQSYSATVQADGSWSVQTTVALSGTVGTRASGTDAAGNSVLISRALTIDPSTPTIGVDAVPTANSDSVADASEDDAITLAGSTTQLADGTVVTVTITDGTTTISDTATVTAGRWSLQPLNLSGMASGTIRVTATALDANGDGYSASTSFGHDRSAVIAIDGISQDTGALADYVTTDTDLTIQGTATPGAAVTVVVKDSGNVTVATFHVSAAAGTGSWTTGQTGVLATGSYTIEATVNATTVSQALRIVAAPTLSASNPADDATGVAVASDLTLTFDHAVRAGSGHIVLVAANGTTIEAFDVATGLGDHGGSLTFNGTTGVTINPGSDLLQSSGYALTIDPTAVVDADGIAYAGIASTTTLNFTTAGSNTAPVNSVPGAQSVDEDAALDFRVASGNAVSVSDAQDNVATSQLVVLHGSLTVDLSGGATVSAGANGSASLTLAGTTTQINDALATLRYQGDADYSGSDTLTVLTSDSAGTPLSDSDTVSITVNAVNDAPVLANSATLTYTENQAATAIDTALTISDADNASLTGATVTISSGYVSAEDTLAFTNQNGITGSFNSSTGVLTLSGTATVAQYQAALRSVTYVNGSDAPSTTNRTVTFQVDDGATLNHASNTVDATVTVAAVNDAPVAVAASGSTDENTVLNGVLPMGSDVDAPPEIQETGAVDYTVGNRTFSFFGDGSAEYGVAIGSPPGGFASIGDMAAAFQAHPNYGNLPYTISVNTAGDGLRLTFKQAGNYAGRMIERWGDGGVPLTTLREGQDLTFAVSTGLPTGKGTLTLNANGSYSFDPGHDFDALGAGQSEVVTFQYTVTDPSGLASAPQTVTLTVNGTNDAPVLANTATLAYTENQAATAIDTALTISDADNASLTGATVTISSGYVSGEDTLAFTNQNGITGSFNSSTGVLTLSGTATVAQYQAALRSVTYVNGSDAPSTTNRTVTFQVDDGATLNHASNTVDATVTVAAVNDAPVAVAASGSTDENTVLNGVLPMGSDVDAPPEIQETGAVDYTVGNRTFSFFGDGSAEYGVAIGSPPGGFASIGDMAAAFQAHPNYGNLPYTISVNTAGDGLRLTFKQAGNYAGRMIERWGDGGVPLTTLREGQDLTFAVSTGLPTGKGTLTLNANGSYSFDPGHDFDALGAGQSEVVTFQYTVTDPSGLASAPQTVTLTVNGTNDAPVLANSATLTYTENQAATAIDTALTISDADNASLTGATVTISSGYVSGEDTLAFTNQNGITGSFNSSTGVLTLSGTATVAQYQAALRSVTYVNGSDAPSTTSRTVTFQVDDGATLNHASNTVDATVTVAAVNNAPSGADLTVSLLQNGSRTFSASNFTITDPDTGDSLSAVRIDSLPLVGSLTFQGTPVVAGQVIGVADLGSLVYAPRANALGTGYASWTFSVRDSAGAYDAVPNTVTVDVLAFNNAPTANADTATTNEDTPVTIDVLANDTDVEGSTLTIASASVDPSQGTVAIVNGRIVFTPAANFSGTATISYVANDGTTDSAPATATVTVNAVNDAPVANADTATTTEDTPVTIDVLANDTDVEGSTLTIASASVDPTQGTVAIVNGRIVFTPTANFSGTATISYVANDGTTDSATGTATVTVNAVNDAPVANADTATTNEDTPVTIDVLANDTDVEGSTLTIASASVDPAQGTVAIVNGRIVFTPAANFSGTATISYVANDGTTDSAPATATVTVNAVNDAPVANADTATTNEDTPVTIDVLANDTDVEGSTLTIASASVDPAQGTVAIVNGRIVFTPAANFSGTATISYVANDGTTDSAPATATVTVNAVNDAPVANADTATTTEDTPVTIDVLANDTDVEGSTLTIASASVDPTQGTVAIVNGRIVFTPTANFSGTATISYVANDGTTDSATGTATVTVNAVNDAPVANADTATTNEDTPVTIDVLANDTDVEGSTLTIASASVDPTQGTVAIVNGRIVFTPAANFSGTATISYVANDGTTDSAPATATVTVNAVNDAPVANADTATTTEDTPVTIDVLANDTDVEGSTLTIASASVDPTQGTVAIVNGRIVFTPTANFSGTATISYVANDGTTDSAPATATVTVNAVNDAPVANADTATTNEDTPVTIDVLANDTDVEGSTLTIASASVDPAQGTVAIVNGRILFTPAANFSGTATISYVANDGTTDSATGTATVTVVAATPVPPAPEPTPEPTPDPVVVVAPPVVVPAPRVVEAAPVAAPAAAPVTAEQPAFDSALRPADGGGLGDVRPPVAPSPAVPADTPRAAPVRDAADGDIYTRPSGFQIMVTPSSEPNLKLFRGVDDQIVPMNRLLVVQVPPDAFVHTVITETVTLSATRADGSPLPSWLSFDGRSGKLIGEPPAGQLQDLAIRVTARDSQGREASTMFRIKVSDSALIRPTSRASFGQQLARGEALVLQPGQRQWHLQGRGLPMRRG